MSGDSNKPLLWIDIEGFSGENCSLSDNSSGKALLSLTELATELSNRRMQLSAFPRMYVIPETDKEFLASFPGLQSPNAVEGD